MPQIKLQPYQDTFLFSEKKFPCLCGGIGTGKTMMLLLKAWQHAEAYPKSVGLIIRKEYTDLATSTLKDFKRYFGVDVSSTKEYKMANGSIIMFRHGSEFDVLKNLSASFIGIEQAEEFETDEQFNFLRDRLRHPVGTRQLCVIANAKGHNWIWDKWLSKKTSEEFHLVTATSFDNEINLPADFVADLRRMKDDSPAHYSQYVMNNFEQLEQDDYVYSFPALLEAQNRKYTDRMGYGHRVMGFDIARFGNDKCAAVGFQQVGALAWVVFHVEQWEHKDLNYTTGRILSTAQEHRVVDSIIDEDGMGAGVLDFIQHGRQREDFRGFRNPSIPFEKDQFYANPRTQCAFKLRDLVLKGHVAIPDEALVQELMSLRFKFTNDGRRVLVSKDEMRKLGIKSPNMADAALMAVSLIGAVKEAQERQYAPKFTQYDKEENLFKLAGVR